MSRKLMFFAVGALSLAIGGKASAQLTTNQAVTWSVDSVTAISTSGGATLHITTAVAGSALTTAYDSSTTYAVTTNLTGRSLTVQSNAVIPAGITLKALFRAPTGATSDGTTPAAIDNITAQTVVHGITQLFESGLKIIYSLDAAITVAPLANGVATIVITIDNHP